MATSRLVMSWLFGSGGEALSEIVQLRLQELTILLRAPVAPGEADYEAMLSRLYAALEESLRRGGDRAAMPREQR